MNVRSKFNVACIVSVVAVGVCIGLAWQSWFLAIAVTALLIIVADQAGLLRQASPWHALVSARRHN